MLARNEFLVFLGIFFHCSLGIQLSECTVSFTIGFLRTATAANLPVFLRKSLLSSWDSLSHCSGGIQFVERTGATVGCLMGRSLATGAVATIAVANLPAFLRKFCLSWRDSLSHCSGGIQFAERAAVATPGFAVGFSTTSTALNLSVLLWKFCLSW